VTTELLALAFSAGALAFAAPCAYPLLPGYVAFFVGASNDSALADGDTTSASTGPGLGRAAIVAAITGLGATVVFVLFAALVAVLGAGIASLAGELELVVGALVVAAGIAFASGRTFGEVSVQLAERSRSPLGFFAFGVTYGVAAAGCSAPVFVGIALAGASRGPLMGATVVGTYATGLVIALGTITVAAALGNDALLKRIRAGTGRIRRIAGVLLVVAGLAQMHYAITVANALA
jgi:cytochrome c-type biogenesis protein